MTSEDMSGHTWFLVSYNRDQGTTVVAEFAEQTAAFAAYMAAERDPETKGDAATTEVVLIGAVSLEAVKAAYPHYFAEGSRPQRRREMQQHFKNLLTV